MEMNKKGIPVMVYYPIPIHKSEAFKKIEFWDMNNTEQLSQVVFSLPMHPYLEDHEIEKICIALQDCLRE